MVVLQYIISLHLIPSILSGSNRFRPSFFVTSEDASSSLVNSMSANPRASLAGLVANPSTDLTDV